MGREFLPHVGDVGELALHDEEVACLDGGSLDRIDVFDGDYQSGASVDLAPDALEEWFERLEVLTRLAMRDFFSGALVGAGADMAQRRNVGGAGFGAVRELGQQFVVVDGVCRRRGRRSVAL
jgi:hypothetical protein